jgi:hypothetical protein
MLVSMSCFFYGPRWKNKTEMSNPADPIYPNHTPVAYVDRTENMCKQKPTYFFYLQLSQWVYPLLLPPPSFHRTSLSLSYLCVADRRGEVGLNEATEKLVCASILLSSLLALGHLWTVQCIVLYELGFNDYLRPLIRHS